MCLSGCLTSESSLPALWPYAPAAERWNPTQQWCSRCSAWYPFGSGYMSPTKKHNKKDIWCWNQTFNIYHTLKPSATSSCLDCNPFLISCETGTCSSMSCSCRGFALESMSMATSPPRLLDSSCIRTELSVRAKKSKSIKYKIKTPSVHNKPHTIWGIGVMTRCPSLTFSSCYYSLTKMSIDLHYNVCH